MKRNAGFSLVLFLWFLALPFENARAQTMVRIGYSGGGTAKNLHKTIEKAGLWKKRGLDVRLIYFTSGATMAQAMVGGDIDIAGLRRACHAQRGYRGSIGWKTDHRLCQSISVCVRRAERDQEPRGAARQTVGHQSIRLIIRCYDSHAAQVLELGPG